MKLENRRLLGVKDKKLKALAVGRVLETARSRIQDTCGPGAITLVTVRG